MVLELPVYSPLTNSIEAKYAYFYNRTRHGLPIVNTWYPPPSNVEFREHLHQLALDINSLSPQVLRDLKATGVRFVVVDKRKIDDTKLRKSIYLHLIADSKVKSVFEIKADEEFGTKDFMEHFLYTEPTLLFKSDFFPENRKGGKYWRWSGRRGEIVLKNYSSYDKIIKFSTIFYSLAGSTLRIESDFFHDSLRMKTAEMKYRREISLKGKSSVKITITSDAQPHNVLDPQLIFYCMNYKVLTIE